MFVNDGVLDKNCWYGVVLMFDDGMGLFLYVANINASSQNVSARAACVSIDLMFEHRIPMCLSDILFCCGV